MLQMYSYGQVFLFRKVQYAILLLTKFKAAGQYNVTHLKISLFFGLKGESFFALTKG